MERETAKINVLYKEFPFLENYLKRECLKSAPKVRRVDLHLLCQIPCDEHINDYGFKHTPATYYYLVDENGVQIDEVQYYHREKETAKILCFTLNLGYEIKKGETVYDCIQRINDKDRIKYIVEVAYQLYGRDPTVTVHKVPNNPDWFAALLKQVEDELHAQLAEIDNV